MVVVAPRLAVTVDLGAVLAMAREARPNTAKVFVENCMVVASSRRMIYLEGVG